MEQDLFGKVENSMLNRPISDSGRNFKMFPVVHVFQYSTGTVLCEQISENTTPFIAVIETLKIVLQRSTEVTEGAASFRDL